MRDREKWFFCCFVGEKKKQKGRMEALVRSILVLAGVLDLRPAGEAVMARNGWNYVEKTLCLRAHGPALGPGKKCGSELTLLSRTQQISHALGMEAWGQLARTVWYGHARSLVAVAEVVHERGLVGEGRDRCMP